MGKAIRILVVAALVVAFTLWWIQRPERARRAFMGHMAQERYEEAAGMLRSPSRLELAPDGSLTVIDQSLESISVPEGKLPFIVGGTPSTDFPEASQMTALGPSTDGVLHTPAVTIHLTVEGARVQIARVDS